MRLAATRKYRSAFGPHYPDFLSRDPQDLSVQNDMDDAHAAAITCLSLTTSN